MPATSVAAIRAEALFASSLQRSDDPTPADVRAAVVANLARFGALGCAVLVAQEFGEHPHEAVTRMAWVLDKVRAAYPRVVAARPRTAVAARR